MVASFLLALLASQATSAPAAESRCGLVTGEGSVLAFTVGTEAEPMVAPAQGSAWPARAVAARPATSDGTNNVYRVEDGGLPATLKVDREANRPARATLFEREAGEHDLPLATGLCTPVTIPAGRVTPRGAGPDILARLAGQAGAPTGSFDCYVLMGDGRVSHVALDRSGEELTLRPLDANVWRAPVVSRVLAMPPPPARGSLVRLSTLISSDTGGARPFFTAIYADLPGQRATMLVEFVGSAPPAHAHCGMVRLQASAQ